MLKFNTDSHRKLSYGKILTPIFTHFKIPFTGVSPKENSSSIFTKSYFERKSIRFFDGHWCYKEDVLESRTKICHETPVTSRPSKQSHVIFPFSIHSQKSSSQPTSSNHEVISLLEELKQHVFLLEDGLMMTMTPKQQATFLNKRNLFVPPVLQEEEHTYQKKPRTESIPVPQEEEHPQEPQTESTPLTAEVNTSSSQPTSLEPSTSDKGKAPTTEVSESDDEETEDELDPTQFRLARRRAGSSKIII